MANDIRQQYAGFGDLNGVSGVASSLDAGLRLGQERIEDGIKYRLVYNAGGSQISKGYVATPAAGSVGPYSVTVTTASDSAHHIGAVAVKHATLTTATYGWGVVKGRVGNLVPTGLLATGTVGMISADGQVATGPSLPTELVGNAPDAVINLGGISTGTGTTDTLSGDFYVDFD